MENDDLKRALEALTIRRVWREAGLKGEAPETGLVCSPFREDKKASFSIFSEGRAWRDHASGDKGGVWHFAKLCWPDMSPKDLAVRLIDLSGIARSAPRVRGADPLEGVPLELRPAARAAMRRRAERAAKARLDADYQEELRSSVVRRMLPAWPEFAEERFVGGCDDLYGDRTATKRLADSRGWPVEWVDELSGSGLVSYPEVPWGGARGVAFSVVMPYSAEGADAVRLSLRTVGYHQRFFVKGRDGEPDRKSWLYVPHVPKGDSARWNHFQREMAAHMDADRAGDGVAPTIPALPFVLGDMDRPRLLVVLEGQWDAVTFFGACGYFGDSYSGGVAVFGVRGAQGVDTWLAYYGPWIGAISPTVWVVSDNDSAGRKWGERGPPGPKGAKVTVADKLLARGARSVVVSAFRTEDGVKDFNDYWKAKRPRVEDMQRAIAAISEDVPQLA